MRVQESVSKREAFERELYRLLDDLQIETEDSLDLRAALTRLKKDPRIFKGDPNGVFTYEDPILAEAAFFLYLHERGRLPQHLSSQGLTNFQGDLDERLISADSSWSEWILVGRQIMRRQNPKSYEL